MRGPDHGVLPPSRDGGPACLADVACPAPARDWDECARILLSTGLEPSRLAHALEGTGLAVPVGAR